MNISCQYNKPTDNLLRLSDSSKKDFDKIKYRYEFQDDFDLIKELNRLPTRLCLTNNIYMPRSAKLKKSITTINTLAQRLYNTLEGTDVSIKNYLDEALDQQDWSVSSSRDALKNLSYACQLTLPKIPPDKGGCRLSSKPKRIIFFLAFIFQNGTNKEPTCGFDDIKGFYVGAFYDFLLDVEPLLKKYLNLTISPIEEVIGKYTEEVLRWHRKNQKLNT